MLCRGKPTAPTSQGSRMNTLCQPTIDTIDYAILKVPCARCVFLKDNLSIARKGKSRCAARCIGKGIGALANW